MIFMIVKPFMCLRRRLWRSCLLCLCTCALLEVPAATGAPQEPVPQTAGAENGFQPGFINSIGNGASPFPRFWRPYVEQPLPRVVLQNSPRLHSLIHDGKLEISLPDAAKSAK